MFTLSKLKVRCYQPSRFKYSIVEIRRLAALLCDSSFEATGLWAYLYNYEN